MTGKHSARTFWVFDDSFWATVIIELSKVSFKPVARSYYLTSIYKEIGKK